MSEQLDRVEATVDDIKVLLCGPPTEPGGMVQQVHDHDEWIRRKMRFERSVVTAFVVALVAVAVAALVAMIRLTPAGATP